MIEKLLLFVNERVNFQSEIFSHVTWIVENIAKKTTNKEIFLRETDLRWCMNASMVILLVTQDREDKLSFIKVVNEFCEKYIEYIPSLATEEMINKLLSCLDNAELRMDTVKCLSTMFTSLDPTVVDKALMAGILPAFTTII